MATKKSATKKPTPKRAPSARKRTTTKTTRKKKVAPVQSFRVSKEQTPFVTFSATKETLYWIVLGIVVVAFATWIIKLQNDIQVLYDRIDESTREVDMLTIPHKIDKKER